MKRKYKKYIKYQCKHRLLMSKKVQDLIFEYIGCLMKNEPIKKAVIFYRNYVKSNFIGTITDFFYKFPKTLPKDCSLDDIYSKIDPNHIKWNRNSGL